MHLKHTPYHFLLKILPNLSEPGDPSLSLHRLKTLTWRSEPSFDGESALRFQEPVQFRPDSVHTSDWTRHAENESEVKALIGQVRSRSVGQHSIGVRRALRLDFLSNVFHSQGIDVQLKFILFVCVILLSF